MSECGFDLTNHWIPSSTPYIPLGRHTAHAVFSLLMWVTNLVPRASCLFLYTVSGTTWVSIYDEIKYILFCLMKMKMVLIRLYHQERRTTNVTINNWRFQRYVKCRFRSTEASGLQASTWRRRQQQLHLDELSKIQNYKVCWQKNSTSCYYR